MKDFRSLLPLSANSMRPVWHSQSSLFQIGFYRKGVVQLELRFRIIQIQAGQRNDFLPPIGQRIAVQEKLCGCQVLVEAVFDIAA